VPALKTLGLALLAVPAAALGGGTVEVTIRDYRFEPATVQVRPGDTVRWVNGEKRVSHSVYFTGAAAFESERLFPGEAWSRQFDTPGRYPYHCGPHPEMQGVVEVKAD
jgi:plastocyanin